MFLFEEKIDEVMVLFIGEIIQILFMYLVVKVNGKWLYEYVWNNELVDWFVRKV